MKFWTIAYPGEHGQHVQETFSEDQIIKSYYQYWANKMIDACKWEWISRERCINDWVDVHWAVQTDEYGDILKESA